MSRRARRVSVTPDHFYETPSISLKQSSYAPPRVSGNKKRRVGICSFRLPKSSRFSAVKFVRGLSAKVAKALQMVSMRTRGTTTSSSSSSKSSRNGGSSRSSRTSFVPPVDSHRTEAIEDCIEFINSSSSFVRSNSVSASSS